VRTVQRWEKDLGLPVRRMGTGRGEVVFAYRAELDAWLATLEKGTVLDSVPGDDAVEAGAPAPTPAPGERAGEPRGRPRLSRLWLAAGIVLALLVAVTAWTFLRPTIQPFEARVERGRLRVYSEAAGLLWEHRFEFALMQAPEAEASRIRIPSTLVDDLNGDGLNEVILITNYEGLDVANGGVFGFDHRGRLLFHHRAQPRDIRYGGMPCPGPWRPLTMTTAPGPGRAKTLWVSFSDRDQFPTVVEVLDVAGNVRGQFWHPGMVDKMVPATYHGRPAMLVGGSSNEFNGGALAILDRQNPTATAPSRLPKFTCEGCPAARPLAYLVLPGTEIERLQDNTSGVQALTRGDSGALTVVTTHTLSLERLGRGTGRFVGYTHYVLDRDLNPVSAQHQPDYRVMHDEAYRRGLLDHPFSAADDDRLFPLLRWNGRSFEAVRPAPASSRWTEPKLPGRPTP
jgi:hypothetical protein